MNGDTSPGMIVMALILVALAASMIPRGVPAPKMLRMTAIWIGIFALFFVVFSFRGPLGDGWKQVTREFATEESSGPGGIVRLQRDDGGHFVARAVVNGRPVPMLVDTGATYTVFPETMARELGIPIDKSGFPTYSSTANGTVTDWRARAETLAVGGIVRNDFPVRVTEGELDVALLGMNWLSTLKSWRVEGSVLVLEP
jgi:aspartyl protease family protein